MTRDKMTEMLSETICVPMEEAEAALEASRWSVLDAAKLLQQEQRARAKRARDAQARRNAGWNIAGAVRELFCRIAPQPLNRDNSAAL